MIPTATPAPSPIDLDAALRHRIEAAVLLELESLGLLIALAKACRARSLRQAFAYHVVEVNEQLDRLEQAAALLGGRGSIVERMRIAPPGDWIAPTRPVGEPGSDLEVVGIGVVVARREVAVYESARLAAAGRGGVRALIDESLAQERAWCSELERQRGALLLGETVASR